MRPSDHDALTRWLAAERTGRPEEADAALARLLGGLPPLAPPRGFAGRVLAKAGVVAVRQATRWASPWLRAALAASTVAVALSLLLVPGLLAAVASLWDTGSVVQAMVAAFTESAVGLASALRLGELLVTLGRALALPLLTPEALAAAVVCLALSALSLRFLRDLSLRERSLTYVQSN
jgi:hypothetical protein